MIVAGIEFRRGGEDMLCHSVRVRARLCAVLFLLACGITAAIVPATWAAEDQVGKIAAVQNQVETKDAASTDLWEPSTLNSDAECGARPGSNRGREPCGHPVLGPDPPPHQ